MKIFDHHHRQLSRNRDNHSRSNYERMQSSNHIYERHKHQRSNRSIRDDNNLLNIRHESHNDEQETSLSEIDHEDHNLL
jgi:hypothetical protein